MLPNDKNLTYILLAVILILGLTIFFVCSRKSTFGSHISIESTSAVEKIGNDSVLIFYAPWCGHCKRSMKDFKQAVSRGQGKIILIDATHEKNYKLTKEYNIRGYPTIIKGDGDKYNGPRRAEEIIDFSKK